MKTSSVYYDEQSKCLRGFRDSILLTEKILHKISSSIHTFKPSKSLAELSSPRAIARTDSPEPIAEIDVVISGGGMKCYYVAGCLAVLQEQLAKNNVKVARVSGASAGAWSALFLCAGIPTPLVMESYHMTAENQHKYLHEVYAEDLWPTALKVIPENAYELCTGRLFVSITVITKFGLKNMMISEFHSNDELIQACCASSTIPYITERSWCRYFRGLPVLDGGLSNNRPLFKDAVRRQLVFQLSEIEYPWKHIINPIDTCIEALVIRGAMQMAQFFSGEKTSQFQWLEIREDEDNLNKPGDKIRRIVTPFAMSSLKLYYLSGLGSVYDFLEQCSAMGTILSPGATMVDFKNAERVFSDQPYLYVLGIVYASVVGFLRKHNLLL
mmetsp:Transcript_25536/g.47872  ORF Transcript_25536/g.47872 Transcript_25536/m.47872 type:complete len:384 (+) Transcript_25536:84-1235(+)